MWDNVQQWGLGIDIHNNQRRHRIVENANAMAVDNECVQYAYEYNNQPRVSIPNQQKFIAERAGTASIVLRGAPLQTAKHTQQSS